MSQELEQRLATLQQQNDELHKNNMELSFRQAELIYENHLLWNFALTAKKFDNLLQANNPHHGSKEYTGFMLGFYKLMDWMEKELKRLEETDKLIKSPTAK